MRHTHSQVHIALYTYEYIEYTKELRPDIGGQTRTHHSHQQRAGQRQQWAVASMEM